MAVAQQWLFNWILFFQKTNAAVAKNRFDRESATETIDEMR